MSAAAQVLALLGVGVLAGIVSTVASLASVVSYPALLALGLPPVSANVTNTVALMFTAVGAAAGSRPELAGQGRRVRSLGLLTAAGGGAGAALLLLTPARGFEYAAPVLIAVGSLAILRRPIALEPDAANASGASADGGWLSRAGVFAVAVYIGYFGAAGGILMLALLTRIFAQSLARTNALKNVISGLANAVAGIGFAIFGPVRWTAALPLAAGFLIGGWIGPALVRRLPAQGLRVFVGICGLAVAIRLGFGTYG
ncbi:MAG TPA: sulfite exporter TauE/SafE family protein [Streptosporangiaceae bacterium]|nr:sulfite exporter TauE/SafE family protein [Streptosporangiaceae bacterium]